MPVEGILTYVLSVEGVRGPVPLGTIAVYPEESFRWPARWVSNVTARIWQDEMNGRELSRALMPFQHRFPR